MDETLRALERRFRETGSLADELAWLRERQRAGLVTEDKLQLAAFCGHRASARLLGLDCDGEALCFSCFQDPGLLWRLQAHGGREAVLRATIAAARAVLDVWRGLADESELTLRRHLWWQRNKGARPDSEVPELAGGWERLRRAAEDAIALAEQRVLGREAASGVALRNAIAALDALAGDRTFVLTPVRLAP